MQPPGKEEVIPIGDVRFFQLAKFSFLDTELFTQP